MLMFFAALIILNLRGLPGILLKKQVGSPLIWYLLQKASAFLYQALPFLVFQLRYPIFSD